MQTQVGKLIHEITGGDAEASRAYLAEITSFKGRDGSMVEGLRTLKFLKGKRLSVTLDKVKKAHAEHFGGQS